MKIFATDYDNTLNCGGVSSDLIAAIDKWREAGNIFGIVTGRPLFSILQMTHDMQISCDFLLADNGAIIADGNGNILDIQAYSLEDAELLIKHLLINGHEYLRIDTPDRSVDTNGNGMVAPNMVKIEDGCLLVGGEKYGEDITEITAIYEDEGERDDDILHIRTASNGRINPLMPSPTMVDFVSGKTGKNIALSAYIKMKNLKPEVVYTTGDSHNDLSMLTDKAFVGYAVPHASEQVRGAVGRIALPIDILTGKV